MEWRRDFLQLKSVDQFNPATGAWEANTNWIRNCLVCINLPYFLHSSRQRHCQGNLWNVLTCFPPWKFVSQRGRFCCPLRRPLLQIPSCTSLLKSLLFSLCFAKYSFKNHFAVWLELFTFRSGLTACWPSVKFYFLFAYRNVTSGLTFNFLVLIHFAFSSKYTEEIVLPGPDCFISNFTPRVHFGFASAYHTAVTASGPSFLTAQ